MVYAGFDSWRRSWPSGTKIKYGGKLLCQKKLLRGVLVDVENEKVTVVNIPDELDEFYKILNCSCIDIVRRKIGRKYFEIICDDEGLFKENVKISAIDNLGGVQLVGNILIVGPDVDDGNLTGLSPADAAYVLSRVQKMGTKKYPDGYPMLTQCEY